MDSEIKRAALAEIQAWLASASMPIARRLSARFFGQQSEEVETYIDGIILELENKLFEIKEKI